MTGTAQLLTHSPTVRIYSYGRRVMQRARKNDRRNSGPGLNVVSVSFRLKSPCARMAISSQPHAHSHRTYHGVDVVLSRVVNDCALSPPNWTLHLLSAQRPTVHSASDPSISIRIGPPFHSLTMRVSILCVVVVVLALVACSVVEAKSHPHTHAHNHAAVVAPRSNSTDLYRVQESRAWLLDASVVAQGGSEVDAAGGWVLFKQCGESWSADLIGESSQTICDVGCAMSSVAMALRTKGTPVDPGTLNTWLIGHGGFEGGDELVWGSVNTFGTIALYDYYHGAGSMSQADRSCAA
jgi:hypothetical protein